MGTDNYQRIVKDGILIQEGSIDTLTKFAQLSEGIDFTDKTVLDVGCNTGMLGYLALQTGAKKVDAIDSNLDVINRAKSLFSEINFRCEQAEDIYGNYDIIIASGMLHYIKDLDTLFGYFSRCAKIVLCDVWLHPSQVPIYALTTRGLYIPSMPAFINTVRKHFADIDLKCETISPDDSKRFVFHLSNPTPTKPEAILISGPGGTGKTTLAQTYFNHRHLMTDNLSAAYRISMTRDASVLFSAAYYSNLVRGHYLDKYLDFFITTLNQWLTGCLNRDIVLEGYELCFYDFKLKAADLIRNSGWEIKEIKRESL